MNRANTRLVIFSCQWSPHYCFQTGGREDLGGSDGLIRIITCCIGRIGEDLVLEAFRQGAHGVWIMGCPPEICRHSLASEEFHRKISRLRKILDMLGIPGRLLEAKNYGPDQGKKLARDLKRFSAKLDVKRRG